MARVPRTSKDDGATSLGWFPTETSTVEIASTSDASTGALPDVPKDQMHSALDWFATERPTVGISSTSDGYGDALPQVAERALPSTTAAPETRAASPQPAYGLAAAILLAAVGGAWWASSISQIHSVPIETSNRAPAVAPVVAPRINPPHRAPIELLSSIRVRPSTRPPIARVVASAPRIPTEPRPDSGRDRRPRSGQAFASTARESRQPRGAAVPSGMRDKRLAVSATTVVPATRKEPAPTAPMAANPRGSAPASEPPPATATPMVASTALPAGSPVLAVRSSPEAIPAVVARTEQSEIQRVLGQYRTAYQLLDADAARAVWPSVDARALARAFDTLNSQELSFEICAFEITGEIGTAVCRGTATYTPKVGSRKPRLEPRQWTFHLRKMDESWKIQSAQTKR